MAVKEGAGDSSSSSRRPRRPRSRASSATGTSSSRAAVTSATCRPGPRRCRPSTRVRSGPGPASTWTTASRRCTSSTRTSGPRIRSLKEALARSDELLLATDGDREGEAIAWHLLQELKPKVPARRMVFHEITQSAIAEAVANPRDLDSDLVDAQETRRILDRLYGYEVSPVLWKKVMPRLSAGRVQSVATRLVVDRERERMAFRAASFWDLDAVLDAGEKAEPPLFPARLTRVGERRVAQGRDFDSRGQLVDKGSEAAAAPGPGAGRGPGRDPCGPPATAVRSVESKPYTRRPYAPFRTTTMQQEAGRKLGFTAQRAMSVAQDLYEAGFITYMRTDSVTLSDTAITAARNQVRQLFGADYLPDQPRVYTSKVKNAQEAHEAIRPAGETFLTPAQTRLTGDQFRLYELIWMRTIASQMKDAEGRSITVTIDATPEQGEAVHLRRLRADHHLPRLPQGLRRVRSTTPTRPPTTPRPGCRIWSRARRCGRSRSRPPATRPGRRPATPSRRWWPSSRSWRSAGPRRTPRSSAPSPVARLRVQARLGAGADLAGLRGHPAAGGALPEAGRLRLHRGDGGGAGPDRRRQRRADRGADRLLLRFQGASGAAATTGRGCSGWSPSWARSTPASCRPSRSATWSRPPTTRSSSGSAATAPTSRTRRVGGPTSPRTCRRTS